MEDDHGFLLIAITPETPVEDEAEKIAFLLSGGFSRVHLRHPSASRDEIRPLIKSLPRDMHSRVVLHSHFDLASLYSLGGLHLNRRWPEPPAYYRGGLSRSCHSVEELSESVGMDYVTLSPIFDSISKPGYKSAFSSGLHEALTKSDAPVIALGGVTPDKIPALRSIGFAGAAMLGAIGWEKPITDLRGCFITNVKPK